MDLGIAQVYAAAGHRVIATDPHAPARESARQRRAQRLQHRVNTARLSPQEMAATMGVHDAMGQRPRYHPFANLIAQVASGHMGAKTGAGFVAGITLAPKPDDAIVRRIEAALANEAASPVVEGDPDPDTFDMAMTLALNFPRGLLAAIRHWGAAVICQQLDRLPDRAPPHLQGRYTVSPALQRLAWIRGMGRSFYLASFRCPFRNQKNCTGLRHLNRNALHLGMGVKMGDVMDGQSNARPVIIKRKKIIKGGGHHGGAWKVAYADFVTAMMAFFMLMWLLNATTEKQRKGLADYFSPTIPVNRISGGGDGAFGGDSVTANGDNPESGVGAVNLYSVEKSESEAASGAADALAAQEMKAQADEIDAALTARSGESMTMEQAMRHVITKVTDEGLVIEIFDLEDFPLFDGLTATPMPVTLDIADLLVDVLSITSNEIAVNGHVRSFPITLVENPTWPMSATRAQAFRVLLQEAGIDSKKIARIGGFADRKPVTANPMAIRNNRLEVILLRRDR